MKKQKLKKCFVKGEGKVKNVDTPDAVCKAKTAKAVKTGCLRDVMVKIS